MPEMRPTRIMRPLGWLALLGATTLSTAPALAETPPGLAEAVRAYTQQITPMSFEYALVDLNDDGTPDALVLLRDSQWCGTGGCTLLILRGKAGAFTLVSTATIINEPIKVAREREHGWHTLLVTVQGGGIQPALVELRFDGKKFPFNPTLQPRASQKQIDAATGLVFQSPGSH
jgi:hypothetical protein